MNKIIIICLSIVFFITIIFVLFFGNTTVKKTIPNSGDSFEQKTYEQSPFYKNTLQKMIL